MGTEIIIILSLVLNAVLLATIFIDSKSKESNRVEIRGLRKHIEKLNSQIEELEKKPDKKTESIELQEFLGDLLTGSGLVRVTRVSPANVLLRSPRDSK